MMAFYRSLYGVAASAEEEEYIARRLALASQTEAMDLSRLGRGFNAEFASSLIRYAPPRGVGMYQDFNPVYGNTCPASQPSFDSDDGLMNPQINQVYGSHPFSDSTIPSQHSFDSTQSAFGSDVTQLGGNPQQILGIQAGQGYVESSQGSPMPGSHPSDLPVVLNRPDLQWLVTTSNVDIRTLTPPNTVSSPHVGMPPRYHAQPGSPSTQPVGHHMMDDRSTSSATISHHHILPRYQNASERPTQSTAAKRGTTVAGQTKPKGTPGRKRKVPDHELTPAEATKRHIRRERNKVAAAKCRNRRRELTDRLQGETDSLEECQNLLHQEILSLQQEKEHLEFILAAHSPSCKAKLGAGGEPSIMQHDGGRILSTADSMQETSKLTLEMPPEVMDDDQHGRYYALQDPHQGQAAVVPVITATPSATRHGAAYSVSSVSQAISGPTDLTLSNQSFSTSTHSSRFPTITLDGLDVLADAPLNTPVCTLATPSVSTGVFAFPSTPGMTSTTATTDTNFPFITCSTGSEYSLHNQKLLTPNYTGNVSFSSIHGQGQQQQAINCAAAHRRSSSSDQSPDSVVQSPKLLAL